MPIRSYLLIFAFINGLFSFGQNVTPKVVNCSGSFLSGTNHALLFSVGEPIVGPISNGNQGVSQGFLRSTPYNLSLLENGKESNMLIYPNPAISTVYFDGLQNMTKVYIQLIDHLGKVVYSGELTGQSFNIEPYVDGFYQIVLSDENHNLVKRETLFKI